MKLYSSNEEYKLYHGSMLDMLDVIEKETIDAIITDPPYELNFMGKGWDNSGIAFQKEAWQKCYDVLKPGGYLLAFGGSRTFHRIACAIEDAGFEIRDTIMWLYGSGFPKSMNIGLMVDKARNNESKVLGYVDTPDFKDVGQKQKELGNAGRLTFGQIENSKRLQYAVKEAQNEWKGWGTCLKPAYEPIIVARKPVEESVINNVLKYGVGGINIDECRVPFEDTTNPATNPKYRKNAGYKLPEKGQASNGAVTFTSSKNDTNDLGRFPANVILSYDDEDYNEVCGNMPSTKSTGSDYDFTFGNQENNTHLYTNIKSGKHYEDEGSASRYFYCAKASKFDRDEGLENLESKRKYVDNGTRKVEGKSIMEGSNVLAKNIHPTVKPIELMRYLVRLVCPKNATILDCFNGSGSTGKAVMLENKRYNKNYKYIGIELTDEYLPIAKARIEYICDNKFDFWEDENKVEQRKVVDKNVSTIFDFLEEKDNEYNI